MLAEVIEAAEKNVRVLLSREQQSNLVLTKKGIANEDTLYFCDNIEAIVHMLVNGEEESIDLVYIDPPFNTSSRYKKKSRLNGTGASIDISNDAYSDSWTNIFEYLEMMTTRIMLIYRLMSKKGTFYLHVDSRTVHYFRLILDHIFGENRFLNEIIWSYKSGGTGRKSYSKKHDDILVYTKTDSYIFNPQKEKSYNRGLKPYKFKGVEEFKDETGWYTLVNLKDVWSIDMVGRTSSERVGYETQKPIKLLKRIIEVSSNADSRVADFFMGSGTTAVAARELGRCFIGSDNTATSYVTVIKRLSGDDKGRRVYKGKLDNCFEAGSMEISAERMENDLKLSISSYSPNAASIAMNSLDMESLKKLQEENPRILIDYIGVIGVNNERSVLKEYAGSNIPEEIILCDVIGKYNELIIELVDIFGALLETGIGGDIIEQDSRP